MGEVFFTISGGIGDYDATPGTRVVFVDYDDLNEPDMREPLEEKLQRLDRIDEAMAAVAALPEDGAVGAKRRVNLADLQELREEILADRKVLTFLRLQEADSEVGSE